VRSHAFSEGVLHDLPGAGRRSKPLDWRWQIEPVMPASSTNPKAIVEDPESPISTTYLIGIASLNHVIAGSATVFYLVSVGKLSLGRYFTAFFSRR